MTTKNTDDSVKVRKSAIKEKIAGGINGFLMIFIFVIFGAVVFALLSSGTGAAAVLAVISGAIFLFSLKGFFMVNPNEGKVLQLFGSYVGTLKTSGLWWTNPFYGSQTVSLRTRNFETEKLKVNDSTGNPIEIATVVVWEVADAAQAVFQVDDFEAFMKVQSESAIRNLASQHPYDQHIEGDLSLRTHTEKIAQKLKEEIEERVTNAGIEIIEARISHLAYAPEIASVMLRQQQASAIIAARQKIVAGAVGMVEMALNQIEKKKMAKLDPERKAAMISNLMVILCGEGDAKPVVNVGSLYN
jgi:regulator of protease activity HflC (stomatin/prohibitin superfamily)